MPITNKLRKMLHSEKLTTLEMINQAKKNVSKLAKETKTLWQNDAYNVCFIQKNDGKLTIAKIQVNWKTGNPCIIIGNQPMTKKEILNVLCDKQEEEEKYNYFINN